MGIYKLQTTEWSTKKCQAQ